MRTVNKYLLKLSKPLNDTVKAPNGLELFLVPQFNHQWNVTTSGFVHTVPMGVKGVKEGDEVAISFKVVSERKFPSHATQFFISVDGGDHYKEWMTSRGYKIVRICLPTATQGKEWVAVITHYDRLVDGIQSPKESEVDNWLSQFPFGFAQKYYYKNIVEINGEMFWRADKFDVYAKRLPDGTLVAINDRIITEPIEIELNDRYNLVNMTKIKGRMYGIPDDKGKVVAAPPNSGVKKGDIIAFEPRYNEKYTLWDKEYFLIRKDFVQGIW